MPRLPRADLEHILGHTKGLWEPLRGQSIFVTGGTGFFGRWILESFVFANDHLALGSQMVVLTRDPAAFAKRLPALASHHSLFFIKGDVTTLTHREVCSQLPPGHSGEFPFLIHAATESGSTLGQDDPLAMFDTIVTGTRAALDFALAAATRRFLLTSSGAVYGRQPSDLTHIPETYPGAPAPAQPSAAYGEGKRAAELLCACYHASHPALEPVIARCFAFVGPGLPIDAHFAAGNFIRDALKGGPIQIGGDGTPCRSYLHAADLAIWLWNLLFRARTLLCCNVGSDQHVTILELATLVAQCFSNSIDVDIARKPTPGAPPSRYVPATALAARALGLTPLIPLREALQRTVAWHLQ
jgi:nucleoside-diphosphate-sugar epimerase